MARVANPARVFGWIGGFSLLLLAFLTPPFEVPDEPQHFFRSYQLSVGRIWPETRSGVTGSVLPASLSELVERFLGTTQLHTIRSITAHPLSETIAEFRRPLEPARTLFTPFRTGSYAPIQYIPQALAIAVGRTFDVGPLALLYAARLANAAAAWALTVFALGTFSLGRRFALVVALLPMTLFVTASCSPDALTIAGAFVFVSLVTRFIVDGLWSHGRSLLALVSGLAMCSIKVTLLPLLYCSGATLLSPQSRRDPGRRRATFAQLGLAVLATVLIGGWLWSTGAGGGSPAREGTGASAQLTYLASDPLWFLRILARSVYFDGSFIWTSMVGKLGWLTLTLPTWLYGLLSLAFGVALYSEPEDAAVPITAIAWLLVLAAGSVMLTELALYLTWTPVRGYKVEGVQGRYFLPILPLLGFCIAGLGARRFPLPKADVTYRLLIAILVGAAVAVHIVIIRAYGLV